MIFVTFLTCVFFLIIGLKHEKEKINGLTIFSMLWGIIIFLSGLQLYNLHKTKDNTYAILLIGIISYGLGYIFIRKFLEKKKNEESNEKNNYELRYKIIYILCAVTILLYIKDFCIIFRYLIEGKSLAYIRTLAQDSMSVLYTSRTKIENCVRMLVVLPFIMAIQPVVAIDLIFGKKNKVLISLDIIILVLRTITDGSRVMFIYFAMHLIFAFMFSKNINYKNLLKNTSLVIGISIISLICIIFTSISRSGENTIKNMYYYFSIEPNMFQQWKDEVDRRGSIGLGTATMNGYIFPGLYFIKNTLFLENYPQSWYNDIFMLINQTDRNWVTIAGTSTKANAYVSLFWFFYLDGRILGVILGSILYGMLIGYFYTKEEKNKNIKNLCIYQFLLQGVVFSFVRMQFANETYALAFLMILFVVYETNFNTMIKDRENKYEVRQ